MNPPSAVLGGGGVHGKVCWLIAYYYYMIYFQVLHCGFSRIVPECCTVQVTTITINNISHQVNIIQIFSITYWCLYKIFSLGVSVNEIPILCLLVRQPQQK